MNFKNSLYIFIFFIVNIKILPSQYHSINNLIGLRAMGLGGAYGAISSDPSGVKYNPAGIIFSFNDEMSSSANAIYYKKTLYQGLFGETADFVEKSGGSIPSFVGGMKKINDIIPNTSFAFGIYVSDDDAKNQKDNLKINSLNIHRFYRSIVLNSNRTNFSGAFSHMLNNNISIGFGLNFLDISEIYQYFQSHMQEFDKRIDLHYDHYKIKLKAYGLEYIFGSQFVLDKFSIGFTLKAPYLIYQYLGAYIQRNKSSTTSNQLKKIGKEVFANMTNNLIKQKEYDKPLGDLPPEIRLGFAWFANPRFLIASDIIYTANVYNADYLDVFQYYFYNRNYTLNYAFGIEYYITSSFPLRIGMFSDFDSRDDIDPKKTNQPDNIDYYGLTFFLGWAQIKSQMSLGIIFKYGTGKAQKTGNDIQNVISWENSIVFSASTNM